MRKNPFTFDVSEILALQHSGKNINVFVIMHDCTGILMYAKKSFYICWFFLIHQDSSKIMDNYRNIYVFT